MSTNLNDLFASLRTDADRVPLPSPEALRRRRSRAAKPIALAVAVGAAVVALAIGSATLLPPTAAPMHPAVSTGIEPSNGPTTVPTISSPVEPSRSPGSGTPTTPPPGGVRLCGADELTYVTSQTGFAMGTRGDTFVLRNRGTTPCRLNDHFDITYGDGNAKVPLSRVTVEAMDLQPQAKAELQILTVNGYGGYDPSSPACAHPTSYPNIAILFPDGSRLPLNHTIDVKCGGVSATWQPGS